MPIVVYLPTPGNQLGPGLTFTLQSSVVDPFPAGTHWAWTISGDPEEGQVLWSGDVIDPPHILTINLGLSTTLDQSTSSQHHVEEDATVYLRSSIVDPDQVVIDVQPLVTTTWSNTAGLYRVIRDQTSTAGGLTDEQALQLEETHTSVFPTLTTVEGAVQVSLADLFSAHTLDQLTLVELTSGCEPGPREWPLTFFPTQIHVRICSWPDGLTWKTAAQDFSYQDLAVIYLRRGVDSLWRRGIHTRSWSMTPVEGLWGGLVLGFPVGLQPPDEWLGITFLGGVTGQVYLSRLP